MLPMVELTQSAKNGVTLTAPEAALDDLFLQRFRDSCPEHFTNNSVKLVVCMFTTAYDFLPWLTFIAYTSYNTIY